MHRRRCLLCNLRLPDDADTHFRSRYGPGGGDWPCLMGFYLARARRIIPALLVLCLALPAVGWFTLPSTDYQQLGTHAITAAAFLSDIKLWREAGYFDAASDDKWLLHTWTLSLEWQFYLLFPVLLMFLWRLLPG